jgi:hypothetical protein
VFSAGGFITNNRRNRLKADNLDMLLSISYNYPKPAAAPKKFELEEIYENCLEADEEVIETARDDGYELEIDDNQELE